MKPSAVLTLVLVAVAALIIAITQFGGGSDNITTEDVGPTTLESPIDVGSLDAPTVKQPKVDTGTRTEAPTTALAGETTEAAPTTDDNRLAGLVTDELQNPVAGVKLRLTRVSATGFLLTEDDHDPRQDRTTMSDANGNYQFAGIEPFDHYVIVATHPDFRRTEVTDIAIGDSGTYTEMVVLLPGHTLTGFVFDEGKNPVPGALLQLDGVFGPTASEAHDDRLTTTTDEAGYYEFTNCTVGHHSLTVTADGYGNQIIRGLQFIEGKGPDQRNVYLKVAERIAGRVVGPDGSPLGGVEILAVSISNSNRQCSSDAVSAADGTFDIGALNEGKYTVVAKMEGYRLERSHRVDTGTADVLLQMRRLSMVTGVVLGPDGVAPASYEVRLRRTHANTDQTTETNIKEKFANADGSFSLSVPSDGTYLVEARAKDYAPTFSQPFRIQDSGDFDGVTINLTIGGVITGTVFSSNGDPISGAVVSTHMNDYMNDEFDQFLGSMNATSVKVRTNEEGKFRIQGLRPDTYQIRVKSSGHVELIKQDIA
ncbi:MAG: carboxypeptidase regulatory-like domain-containing protein, partial [Planctomycetes bacterium]|nr:carboxypeptidase regulatory-like domain-containing protein [Planctomycetota bacterium]